MKSAIWWMVGAVLATGCAPLSSGMYGDPEPKPVIHAFNAVKRITPSVTNPQDESMWLQSSYPLGPSDHLLLRFNELKGKADAVRTDGDNKVQVQITVIGDAADVQAAVDSVSVCPLTHDFMMYATWTAASQWGHEWKWNHEGGDYDEVGCKKGEISKTDPQSIVFPVTQWFIDYAKAKGVNFGQILISSRPVTIAGNNSGSGYPRLLWSE
jgi:hypothetical protein